MLSTVSDRYHLLREELMRLQSADVRDMPAIEHTLDELAAEYRRLKSLDGQHGNNPIEWRHGEPPDASTHEPVEENAEDTLSAH